MKLENWLILLFVSVGGAGLLYPIRRLLTWDAITTAALVAASLLIVSLALAGLYAGLSRLVSWLCQRWAASRTAAPRE